MDIAEMKVGQKGKIKEIAGGFGVMRRLDMMGIRPGVEVTKISSQFLRGPVVIQTGNTQVAVGYGMAKKIIVTI